MNKTKHRADFFKGFITQNKNLLYMKN